jgi:hypothetical protein
LYTSLDASNKKQDGYSKDKWEEDSYKNGLKEGFWIETFERIPSPIDTLFMSKL